MIEIIAGIIVLILAIIGIAKLAQRRGGGGGGGDIDTVVKMAENSIGYLEHALKNPEHLYEAMQSLQYAAKVGKDGIKSLSSKMHQTRGRVDAALAKYNVPTQDKLTLLYTLMELQNFAAEARGKYQRKELNPEQFLNYLKGKVNREREDLKETYRMRHSGFA
jgi:hypothetical protein